MNKQRNVFKFLRTHNIVVVGQNLFDYKNTIILLFFISYSKMTETVSYKAITKAFKIDKIIKSNFI